jgi:hypothetical protein
LGFHKHEFVFFFLLLDSSFFGLSQEDAESLAEVILTTTDTFKRDPAELSSFLLKSDDLRVKAHLDHRVAESSTSASSASSDKEKWPASHEQFLAKKGLSRKLIASAADVRTSPWFDTLTPREQECLGYGLRLAADRALDICSVELGQSIDRLNLGKAGVLPTIVPRSLIWLRQAATNTEPKFNDRLLLGFESLALQGYDMALIDLAAPEYKPSEFLLQDLAGNAFSLPIVLSICVALLLKLDVSGHVQQELQDGPDPSDLLGLLAD